MRVAVAGLGFMGSTHVKAWQSVPGAELFAVISSDESKLAGDLSGIQGNLGGRGERFDFSRLRRYRSLDEALADREIDAVDLCIPTAQHAPAATAALRAGKHVLVEKPLALTPAQSDALVEEARRAGRVLMAGHVLRFMPQYRTLAELLPGLGYVHSALFRRRCAAPAWSRWLADPAQSGGGVFDLLIHDLDMCLRLFGKPRAVSASGSVDLTRGIDFVLAQLHYDGRGPVTVTGGWHHPATYPFSMEFTVVAQDGTLDYSSLARPLTIYTAEATSAAMALEENDPWVDELAYFTECAAQGREPELCPPVESAAAVHIAYAMLESRDRGGAKIPCNL